MNSADNFRGAEIGAAQKIDIYFESALSTSSNGSYDRVRLDVGTAGNEEKALEALAGAMQGNKSGLTVIADDKNSVYFNDFFNGVDSFTTASQSNKLIYEDIQAVKALAASDSGKIFGLDLLAGFTVTLPAVADAGAGWYCEMVVKTVTTSNNYIVTEKTASDTNKIVSHMGLLELDTGDDGLHSAAHSIITFEATPAKGDKIRIFCDGTFFYATGIGVSDDFVALT
tara:strand:+ start:300 stop:980 length:681 start_codon:yes stop_codon:yes gene_type:complete